MATDGIYRSGGEPPWGHFQLTISVKVNMSRPLCSAKLNDLLQPKLPYLQTSKDAKMTSNRNISYVVDRYECGQR